MSAPDRAYTLYLALGYTTYDHTVHFLACGVDRKEVDTNGRERAKMAGEVPPMDSVETFDITSERRALEAWMLAYGDPDPSSHAIRIAHAIGERLCQHEDESWQQLGRDFLAVGRKRL